MKILFVGDKDALASDVLERLAKEENDVHILTNQLNTGSRGQWKKYKTYQYDQNSNVHDIFLSVNPDAVIFAGAGFRDAVWNEKQRNNLTLLAGVLEECRFQKRPQVVLLSTLEVYGSKIRNIDEQTPVSPETSKGTWMVQCENMVASYHKHHGLTAAILRLGPVYSRTANPAGNDWLGRLIRATAEEKLGDEYLQPVNSLDVADAVVRVLATGSSGVYNICGSDPIRRSALIRLLHGDTEKAPEVQGTPEERLFSNDHAKKDLEWLDFWKLDTQLQDGEIVFRTEETRREKRKAARESKSTVRKVIENIVIFAVFAALYVLSSQHQLFAQIHWMLIYVMIVSLCYGVRQGTLSVVFASAAYLIVERGNIFEMTNFYSYVGNVLVIVEFIFFGIVIGYAVESLREENRISNLHYKELQTSYTQLRDINSKNMLIKNEYEKRLLEAKNTIPNIYSIISRINVLNVDRIFVEVLQVVKELLQTDTVALYQATPKSNYLRLVTSLNEKSLMQNRSWNITDCPAIQEAIRNNAVYQGDIWKQEPAIVMSIPYAQGGSMVLVIKNIAMEYMSLYYINILRTLFLLISDALEKACRYDSAVREDRYVEDTDILVPGEFRKTLDLAEEKERREVADYVLLHIESHGDGVGQYHQAEKFFRDLDQFGMDRKGELHVLLSNASKTDAAVVIDRLKQNGVTAEVAQDFQVGELK